MNKSFGILTLLILFLWATLDVGASGKKDLSAQMPDVLKSHEALFHGDDIKPYEDLLKRGALSPNLFKEIVLQAQKSFENWQKMPTTSNLEFKDFLTVGFKKEVSLPRKSLSFLDIELFLPLLQKNPFLTKLDLFRNEIGDIGAYLLSTASSSLCVLSLEENKVRDKGALALARNTTLKELNLWKNNITSQGVKGFRENRTLKHLGLYKNSVGDEGALYLSENKSLTFLDLRQAGIGHNGAQALSKNNTLRVLRLRHNQIGDEGAKAFVLSNTLTHLELAHNKVSQKTIEVLGRILPNNGLLMKMSLPLKVRISDPTFKKSVKILSVDGGGIRGLLPAILLHHLEGKLCAKWGKQVHLAEIFDVMGGTSTGGIITLSLNISDQKDPPRPLHRAKVLVDLYQNKGQDIFPKGYFSKLKSLVYNQYSPDNLKCLLGNYFKGQHLSQSIAHVMIPAFETLQHKGYVFDSLKARKNLNKDFRSEDVALSTSAAPTYFPAARIKSRDGKDYTFIDGGLYANNPTVLFLQRALKVYPNAKEYVVVSLGTGVAPSERRGKKLDEAGLLGWAPNIAGDLMSIAAQKTEKILADLVNSDPRIKVHRIQPILHKTESSMDNVTPENVENLKAAAHTTIGKETKTLDEIVRSLR